MPKPCTTSESLFPPQTRAVPCDEKWACVGKKDQHCDPTDPADARQGDNGEHGALDPEHRLGVSGVPGQRTAKTVEKLGQDCQHRTAGRSLNLLTSDEYPAYPPALLNAYGTAVVPPRTGKPGRPQAPYTVAPPELRYATVPKTREQGRVVQGDCRVVCGTAVAVLAALAQSRVSKALNPACSARQNGTDRHRTARKVRKRSGFSQHWDVPEAVTSFTMYSYNFCWPVRTLRVREAEGHWRQRTPAMAAGLSDHIWTLSEWLTFPGVQRK